MGIHFKLMPNDNIKLICLHAKGKAHWQLMAGTLAWKRLRWVSTIEQAELHLAQRC